MTNRNWKRIDETEAARLIKAAQDDGVVVTFCTPPECGGQIVERSYAGIGQYGILFRSIDRSDGTVSWQRRDWRKDDEEERPGLNFEPQ